MNRRSFVKTAAAMTAALVLLAEDGAGKDLLRTITPEEAAAQAVSTETVSYCCHKSGPTMVHVNAAGSWYKSSLVKANQPTAHRLMALRNRTYAPDRVLYPMMRVGWAPGGKSDNSNRGKDQFVQITWAQAYSYIVSEFQRIYTTYGPGAAFATRAQHQWGTATVQVGITWPKNLLAAMGGYTNWVGGESSCGWSDSCYTILGEGLPGANSFGDLVANCKMIIFWGCDRIHKTLGCTEGALMLQRYKAAGVKLVVIDPYFNETAAHNADKYISLVPGTDEALLAAIAYVWIQAGTYNQTWLNTHTIGFDEAHLPAGAPTNSSFKSYILGSSDGVPKTPAWAAPITGVPARTITALAQEWAAKPTYIDNNPSGAQRRYMGGEFVRMLTTICAMQGLGMSGRGLGYVMYASSYSSGSSSTLTSVSGGLPSVSNPVTQTIQHRLFPDAILTTTPVSWTTGHDATTGGPRQLTYPAKGYSRIKMIYGAGGSDLVERPGGSLQVRTSLSGSSVEFICLCNRIHLYPDFGLDGDCALRGHSASSHFRSRE